MSPGVAIDNPVGIVDFELLPMNVGDLDAVLEIENALYPFPWTAGNFRDALKAGYGGWICRRDEAIIGYAVLMLACDEAHLLNISLAAELHGRGLGARLLHAVMDIARGHSASCMLLEVRPSNERALVLYRQFGFVQIGVRRNYYPAAAGREDAIVMSRPLRTLSA